MSTYIVKILYQQSKNDLQFGRNGVMQKKKLISTITTLTGTQIMH
jgi:hypothetical protein